MNQYIDINEGLGRVRGNKTIYKKMMNLFLSSEEFAVLETALNEKDYEKAVEAAHSIKGISGNLSLTQLFLDSTTLLGELRSGSPQEMTIQNYYNSFKETRAAVVDMMKTMD